MAHTHQPGVTLSHDLVPRGGANTKWSSSYCHHSDQYLELTWSDLRSLHHPNLQLISLTASINWIEETLVITILITCPSDPPLSLKACWWRMTSIIIVSLKMALVAGHYTIVTPSLHPSPGISVTFLRQLLTSARAPRALRLLLIIGCDGGVMRQNYPEITEQFRPHLFWVILIREMKRSFFEQIAKKVNW